MVFFVTGVTGGVTKWGYILKKVGLQNRVLRVQMERGYKYGFPHFGLKNHADSTPSISTPFSNFTLLYIGNYGLGRGEAAKEMVKM